MKIDRIFISSTKEKIIDIGRWIIIKAKDIHDCEDCPLLDDDCPGGWTSGTGGTPIEPPCCSWNNNDEIYKGMYGYYEE